MIYILLFLLLFSTKAEAELKTFGNKEVETNLSVGGNANISGNIDGEGGLSLEVNTVSSTYTSITSDHVILANGTFTVTLYTAVSNAGNLLYIKNIGNGIITIDGNSSETIDGSLTETLSKHEIIRIVSDGSNWWII